MRIAAILCVLLLIPPGSPLEAGEKLTMKVSPDVAFAPADFVVRARIEANAENRALEIIVDSPDFYRSSVIELEGEHAPRMAVFELRNLPGGRYLVTARLFGPSGQVRSAIHQTANVLGRDGTR